MLALASEVFSLPSSEGGVPGADGDNSAADTLSELNRRQADLVSRLTALQRRREEARLLEEWPAFEAASLDRPEQLVLRHSWELVQAVHFLRLAAPVLCLPLEELTVSALEWAMLLPRQSRLLAYIVNSMLTRSSSR